MISNFTNYFMNLNGFGQALFIVGVLLVITFIALLIVVFKPEKNKVKKIYGESAITDNENIFEEKMKDIDNIGIDDINIDNDKTRNLKSIVDELKCIEAKSEPTFIEKIEAYEDEQEDTAIISVEELLRASAPNTYEKKENFERKEVKVEPYINKDIEVITKEEHIIVTEPKTNVVVEEKKEEIKYTPRREIFSSVYTENTNEQDNNENFLNSLKEFRNNL